MLVCRSAILILTGLPLMAQESVRPAGKGVNFYSLEKEAALGRQLAAEFRKRTTFIHSLTVQDYLDHLGHRLESHLPDSNFPFTFSAIAEDPCPAIHEPAALPGGYVFVPAALFIAAQDEAEFSGMLAHAMEHIAQRHGTRQATRGTMVNYSSVPLIFMGGGCSEGHAIPLAFMASQRSAELEADFLAVQTIARAGFDPRSLVQYLQRVQVRPEATISKAYSPLPDRDQRLVNILSAIEKLPTVDYAAAAPAEFAAAQQELRSLAKPPVRPQHPPTLMRKTPE
jgi:predicted Zn-dependent protease